MVSTINAGSGLSDAEHGVQLRRAVIASTVGTAIEWYDFFLYGTAAGLVFPKLFFPNDDPLVGTLNSFLIYGAGFLARPVGAAIFGHYGDRIGRKATLIATLMLMGIATFLVAFVPTYSSIGVWGAIILTVLRFIQGVGVGGEWGGSVLLSMEWARSDKSRGFIASWPQFGVPCGLFLANLAFLVFSQAAGDQFLTWGWRIPFALSIVLVGIGLWIRLGILETPVFNKLVAEKKIERQPMIEVMKRNWREIITSAFVRLAEQAPFYIFTAFVFSYGVNSLKVSGLIPDASRAREFLLYAVMAASCLSFVSIPLSGHISDLIGRKKMYMIGAATVGVFGFIYFAMLNAGSLPMIFIAIVLSLVPHDMMYGPQAALIAESFTGRLRYSGASMGYQLASIIAGGPAPIIAGWLLIQFGSGYAIAGYILACAVISLIATSMMKDYTGKDIEGEYE
ncbi:MAG TPA: MFS transporter [Stellaceae bacterium]|nr:MFS transporter [Stellaceae bacterium]